MMMVRVLVRVCCRWRELKERERGRGRARADGSVHLEVEQL